MTTANTNSAASDTGPAIAKLRDATETLEKREEHLQRKIDNEIKQAQQFSKQNKKKEALTCIKRKKMYEKQMEQLSNAKMTLETQRCSTSQALPTSPRSLTSLLPLQVGPREHEHQSRSAPGE